MPLAGVTQTQGAAAAVATRGLPRERVWLGGQRVETDRVVQAPACRGGVAALLHVAPPLMQHDMLRRATVAAAGLQRVDPDEWWSILERAATYFEGDVPGTADAGAVDRDAGLLSACSGLPVRRIRHAWSRLADQLMRMKDILSHQPAFDATAARHDRSWRWAPAGRHVAIRIAGNFPTSHLTWLMALGARRPVVLCAPREDSVTTQRLVASVYAAGAPDGAVSLCHVAGDTLLAHADQVLLSGSLPGWLKHTPRVHLYHNGRSKTIVAPRALPADYLPRLVRQIVQGGGRLCTNPSALVIIGDALPVATRLAEALAELEVLPLDDPEAIVPAFPSHSEAEALVAQIEAAVARGAVDLSERATGLPLRLELDGCLFLRPTVLLVDRADPLFGAELPFPFVTVASVPRRDVATSCRDSLVVAVVGDAPDLVAALAEEPTIDKVLFGEDYDRGYRPEDPHEGYVTDVLFFRKTMSQDASRPGAMR